MLNNTCEICKKWVQSHERIAICNLCSKPSHLQCLTTYNKLDNICAANPNGHWSCRTCLANLFQFYAIEENATILQEIHDQTKHIHDIDTLNTLIFHQYEINEIEELNKLDPDKYYYNSTINHSILGCRYYKLNFKKNT